MIALVHTRSNRRTDRPGVRQAHLNGRHRRNVEAMTASAPQCTHAFRLDYMPLLWVCNLCGAAVTHEAIGGPKSVVVARLRAIKTLAHR